MPDKGKNGTLIVLCTRRWPELAGGGLELRRDAAERKSCYGKQGNDDAATPRANQCAHEHQGGSRDTSRRPGAKEVTGAELAAEDIGGGGKLRESMTTVQRPRPQRSGARIGYTRGQGTHRDDAVRKGLAEMSWRREPAAVRGGSTAAATWGGNESE